MVYLYFKWYILSSSYFCVVVILKWNNLLSCITECRELWIVNLKKTSSFYIFAITHITEIIQHHTIKGYFDTKTNVSSVLKKGNNSLKQLSNQIAVMICKFWSCNNQACKALRTFHLKCGMGCAYDETYDQLGQCIVVIERLPLFHFIEWVKTE